MKKTGIVIIVILIMIATTTVVVGQLLPPFESYWGYATLDDASPTLGTSITVEVYDTKEVVGENVTLDANGLYSLDVSVDDLGTPEDEGANESDPLTWKINGIVCSFPPAGTDTADKGCDYCYLGENHSGEPFNITASSPALPPVAVPGCNMIGLLALIVLSVMLASATLKKKK